MTEPQNAEQHESEPEPLEPEYSPAPTRPEDEPDPVTARNPDPAAMSEHERNLRQTEQYNAGL